ncbi:MAG: hypothetical protein QOJ12_3016, partial [Thermoleophilales bacterium]|nr:hypothetical protein [Thermoleophilales bacterium]
MLLSHARLGRTWVLRVLVCLLLLAAGVAVVRPGAAPAAAADTFNTRLVACSSSTRCTVVDGNPGPSKAVTFDPSSTGLKLHPTQFFNSRVARLSCSTSTQCVAVGWTSPETEHGSARA